MEGKKVTIYDIAEKTGFSAVTVHRALSNKGRISEKTKALILKTARELEYEVNPAAQGLRRTPIKIGAVLNRAYFYVIAFCIFICRSLQLSGL